MAKILLLALAVGLAHALNELEGDWVSIAIAADNVEKIENQGTMRLYARQITSHEECDKLEIIFYVNTPMALHKASSSGVGGQSHAKPVMEDATAVGNGRHLACGTTIFPVTDGSKAKEIGRFDVQGLKNPVL
ncbi:Aphrodisin [Cricetulus griseus]|uniref:Aphrodisin n=1 Tax=Cricetulus griseus TaxID=10029 RepID=G3IMD4_CRIGR|nr:Aphrodisin [Cricetulus griseus]